MGGATGVVPDGAPAQTEAQSPHVETLYDCICLYDYDTTMNDYDCDCI